MRALVAGAGLVLAAEDSLSAELGGTKAAEGATELTDAVADSLLVADAVAGARLAGPWAGDVGAALDGADAASDVGGLATRGAAGSVLVAGGFTTAVDVATVDGATTAAVLVCTGDGGWACVGGCGA